MSLWYLSFATKTKFLGAHILEADDLIDAVRRAHAIGANPGGEVMGHGITDEAPRPLDSDIGRLLTREDVDRIDKRAAALMGSDGPAGAVRIGDLEDGLEDYLQGVFGRHNEEAKPS